jgi:hypothetical protein
MTQVYIIAGIIITISMLICYVYIRQTITQRTKEKMRLRRALDKRASDLVQMLNAFPANFLPRDLQVFLYRCIVDVYEQLSKLAPSEAEYMENFQAYTSHMENSMRAPKLTTDVNLQNPAQINDIRQYLNYLGRFLQKWMQRGNISQKQYNHYKDLLKKLATQLMVDNYTLSAKQALQIEKPKLAIHHYLLAKSLLAKEDLIVSKQSRVSFVEAELKTLEEQVRLEDEAEGIVASTEEVDEASAEDRQWQKYDEQANWKKKNFYD